MTRSRTYNRTLKNGIFKRNGVTFGGQIYNWETATCIDSPGFGLGDNLPLTIDRFSFVGGGTITQNVLDPNPPFFGTYFYPGFVADGFTNGGGLFPLITSYSGEQSTVAYATQAAARTTPNHPNVDMIQNVLELGDIPRAVQVASKNAVEKMAEDNLRNEFGLKPIIKDINKLLDFAHLFNKKMEKIMKLKETGGYRSTVTLDKLSEVFACNNVAIHSSGVLFVDSWEAVGKRVIRGHVRWLPNADYSKYTQVEMSAMAKRAVIGLEANFSGLWEGLPWSWLIDWYSNVGDLLMLTRNIIPVTLNGVSIIRTTTTTSTTHLINNGTQTIHPGTVIKERKERYPGSVTLEAHLPLLTASQMGILASLLVMKTKYASPR